VKKRIIQVAGNPQYARKPRPSEPIINPATGLPQFGFFPSINSRGVIFVGGPILLRYGEHYSIGRGWGFEHIWQARFPECQDQHSATQKVIALICSIITSGAKIHYEYVGHGSGSNRSSVFKSKAGVVIVEERQDGQNSTFYSIVTAFFAQKVYGPVIGAI
jgi:hypothetical protein